MIMTKEVSSVTYTNNLFCHIEHIEVETKFLPESRQQFQTQITIIKITQKCVTKGGIKNKILA